MGNDFLKKYDVKVYNSESNPDCYRLSFINDGVKNFFINKFTIPVKNAHFSAKKRNKQWDGKARIIKKVYNKSDGYWETIIPKGLWFELYTVAKNNNYVIQYNVKVKNEINIQKVKDYIDNKYQIQSYIKNNIRDFQYKCVFDILKYNFVCGEAVPASGKSLIIYIVCRLMLEKNYQSVIIVPNVALCSQLYNDFVDYGFKEIKDYVQIINGEKEEKNFVKKIVITTWQTLQNRENYDDIDVIIADESDLSKNSKSKYFNIIKDCTNKKYSLALTGTVPDKKFADYYTFVGNTGIHKIYTTEKQLEELKQITKVKINVKVLNYSTNDKKDFHFTLNNSIEIGDSVKVRDKNYFIDEKINSTKFSDIINKSAIITNIKGNTYELDNKYILKKSYVIEETGYLKELRLVTLNKKRLNYLCNSISELTDGNILVLFSKKSKEGYILKDYLQNNISDKELVYIDGDTKNKNEYLDIVRKDKSNNKLLLASIQVLGRGITVKNLKYCFFVTSMKSAEQLRQAIGRISRLCDNKDIAYFYDIVDNYTLRLDEKLYTNCSTESYLEREKIYKQRGYEIVKENVNLLI